MFPMREPLHERFKEMNEVSKVEGQVADIEERINHSGLLGRILIISAIPFWVASSHQEGLLALLWSVVATTLTIVGVIAVLIWPFVIFRRR